MLTSAQIRQSFLDFFREKKHTIVPSSSLMPDSPNLLFTNAGMNQFVPIFLGERKADVDKWAGAVVERDAVPTRAADTQKCIRAGGKHNDLDDVGLDTYHHTFFEMLGNWSFGDYFKKEAIEWAWELVVERWKFPAQRLYATVYHPHMDRQEFTREVHAALNRLNGKPVESATVAAAGDTLIDRTDRESIEYWAEHFRTAGLDPLKHIVPGDKKDNFWMMGETGPCGPCSELHVDLTPAGDTCGALVNKGTAECIEIWNLVFIQFNANADGNFSPLPAKHVDTGMGFERVTSIIQGTKAFTDFANAKISNYETDIFRPIFDEIEKLSGHKYGGTLPEAGSQLSTLNSQLATDVAFRVIADHIRTLSFAIADGIQPGNTDRNYVLRRILRRAVRYGRTLGFHEPFFYKLVAVLARTMGDTFPEIRTKQKHVEEVLRREEEAFNKTLDRGIDKFNAALHTVVVEHNYKAIVESGKIVQIDCGQFHSESVPSSKAEINRKPDIAIDLATNAAEQIRAAGFEVPVFRGVDAFELYDTYGFPLDLTELMARERGLTVDTAGFEVEMEKQRARARAAQKKQVIAISEIGTPPPTKFIGYDSLTTSATVLVIARHMDKTAVILDATACYGEMGGQVGDTGEIAGGGQLWNVINTQKSSGAAFLHVIESVMGEDAPAEGSDVTVTVDAARRGAIQRHHTVTHLLHWALHQVVSREASQKGSYVGPEKLTFDFNHQALTPQQVRDVERLVNERIVENAPVSWIEMPYADVRGRGDIMQFFCDKYGETVRVVQIGGGARSLDGYSMELCAGTHTRATGEIGLFRINAESAIAAGVRRIEAQAGLNAYDLATADTQRLHALATKLGTPLPELEKRIEGMVAQQKELEKALKAAQQRDAASRAKDLLASAETINGIPAIIARMDGMDGDGLQTIADALKVAGFKGVVVLGGSAAASVALVASLSPDFTAKVQAGKIIQQIAPIVGGKGGGKPEGARGGGKDPSKLDEALAKAKELLG